MTLIKRVLRIIYRGPQILLGLFICKIPIFAHKKQHLLSTWHDFDKRSTVDNAIFPYFFEAWIRFEYLMESDPDKREELKSQAMGSNSGAEWAKLYDSRPLDFSGKVGHMTFHEAIPLFKEIEDILEKRQDLVVIQIGSSSGREIAYFASKYPESIYIGSDIYIDVVAYSRSAHESPNLTFELGSAKDVSQLLSPYRGRNILVYSSGSLQYAQPEHLRYFFKSLANYPNLKIVLLEPANESKGIPDELKTSIWRGNFSYTHDYKYYAEEACIETVKSKVIRPYFPYREFPIHRNTAHYFYSGKTKS